MMDKPVGYVFTGNENETVAPCQRLHLILLGVENVAYSTASYESLGWKKSPTGHADFTKIDLGGYALCLLPRDDFAKDALYDSSGENGFSGVGFVYLAKVLKKFR